MFVEGTIHFAADPVTVANMLADPDYVLAKVRGSGAVDQQIDVTGGPSDAFTVSSRRTMKTDRVPAAFRTLVGATIDFRQVEAWESAEADGTRVGSMVIEVIGTPIRFTGTVRLASDPEDPTKSIETISGDLKASIPLFGSAIEKAAAPAINAAIRVEERASADWLAKLA